MEAAGLSAGLSGNLSVRRPDGEGFYVTPSAVPYAGMKASDVVSVDWSGVWAVKTPGRRPSSEWRFHRDILKGRPEFGAVVHAHAVHATALAVQGRGLGPFHYMIAAAGGRNIRCAAYATFGTEALSAHVMKALDGRRACLIAHHGLIACGRDLEAALTLAVEIEALAAQYLAACVLGEPPELSNDEIAAVLAKMEKGPGYGSAGGGV